MLRTHRSGLAALAVAALLASTSSAHAKALTTPACLAKKLGAWGTLRKCQAGENGKALQGKPSDPVKCPTKFDATLTKLDAQATKATIACRYGVNGDGTATDYDTGLQWEQKANLDSTPNLDDPHDADNTYAWSTGGTAPDGPAFTSFLASLNDCASGDGTTLTGGLAGHCDWRLPSSVELAGIRDPSVGECNTFTGPCIDQAVFGPTVAAFYWSATTYASGPGLGAFLVGFGGGSGNIDDKDIGYYVRGVRSAL